MHEMTWFHLLTLLTLLVTHSSGHKCCPGDQFLQRKICSDNETAINLNCSAGAYLLNPTWHESDSFILDGAGNLLLTRDPDLVVTAGDFCISTLPNVDGEAHREVALVCFASRDALNTSSSDINFYWPVLMSLSVVFLLVTLLVYCSIPDLRDLQGKLLMAMIVCMIGGYMSVVTAQLATHLLTDTECVILGFAIYFFMLSIFTWMNTVACNVWRSVVKEIVDRRLLQWLYVAWGLGVPSVLLGAAIIAEHMPGEHVKPQLGVTKCWFEGTLESWLFFHGPSAFCVLLNTTLFIWTSMVLWRDHHETLGTTVRSQRFKFLLYLKLGLLMGVMWVFELASYALKDFTPTWIWSLTDCVNALQGVLIFLILIVFRQRVRRGLATHRVCGLSWPSHWANQPDMEIESLLAEEVELSDAKA